jgi:hypothetical protein
VISAQAGFDVLQIVGSVGESSDGVTLSELQTLDYLACLLSIYGGVSPTAWGFGFSVTDSGAPFASTLADAVEALSGAGWLLRNGRVCRLGSAGRAELGFQRRLAPNKWRIRYLQASVSATLSMPMPALADALGHEPGLRRALQFMRRKRLLDDTSLELVEAQFEALTAGLGEPPDEREDLTLPTVVWLTYLARSHGESEVRAA